MSRRRPRKSEEEILKEQIGIYKHYKTSESKEVKESKEEIKFRLMDNIIDCKLTDEGMMFFDSEAKNWIPANEFRSSDIRRWFSNHIEAAVKCKRRYALSEKEEIKEEEEEEEPIFHELLANEEKKYSLRILGARYNKNCKHEVVVQEEGLPETYWTSECDVPIYAFYDFKNKYPIGSEQNPKKPSNCRKEFKQTKEESEIIKNMINDYIVKVTRALPYAPLEHRVLILDAPNLNTALRFYQAGIRSIVIPNPFECLAIKNNILKTPGLQEAISVVGLTFGEYLFNLPPGPKFTCVWDDGTNCYTGNKSTGILPREDIKMLFEKNLLYSPSIFAFTTSIRCYRGRNWIDQLGPFLEEVPGWNKSYCFTNLLSSHYSGKSGKPNMGVSVLYLEKKPVCPKFDKNYSKEYKKFKEKLEIMLSK